MPYWFDLSNPAKRKLFVVGINPLRKRKDFTGQNSQHILINSGWGAHNEFAFKRSYRDFFHCAEQKHSLYLTDFQKVYFQWNGNRNSYEYKPFASLPKHKQIFEQELKMVNPDLIVCFGANVANALGINKKFQVCNNALRIENHEDIPFIQFPHFAARPPDFRKFFANNPIPNDLQAVSIGIKFCYLLNQIILK